MLSKRFKSKFLVLLFALSSLLVISDINNNILAAEESVVKELTIRDAKEEYSPGEIIMIDGKWDIPDGEYKPGDKFSITIPDGLRPDFTEIGLSGYGHGKVEGNKIVFTFEDKIEGQENRHGGFELRFSVDTPEKDGINDVDLVFSGEKGNDILNKTIQVNKPDYGEVGPSQEKFVKWSTGRTKDGLEWYVRINADGLIEKDKVDFKDKLGENQILKANTIKVLKYDGKTNSSIDVTDTLTINIIGDNEFTVEGLELRAEGENYNYYSISYESKYTGDEKEGSVYLYNKGELNLPDGENMKPENSDDAGLVSAELYLGSSGWGTGENGQEPEIEEPEIEEPEIEEPEIEDEEHNNIKPEIPNTDEKKPVEKPEKDQNITTVINPIDNKPSNPQTGDGYSTIKLLIILTISLLSFVLLNLKKTKII